MSEQQLNVLVVEDEFFVKTEIIRALNSLGHKVVGDAANGKAALQKTLELHPDIILMDIEMSEMNGLDAARHIQAQAPTPIVFLSAHETPDMVKQASESGAAAYLTKPPNAADIDRALTVAMARHQDLMKLCALNEKQKKQTLELKQSLAEVKSLQGILPICCYCKRIRDDKNYWSQVETYIEEHTESQFSHGICPECALEHHNMKDSSEPHS